MSAPASVVWLEDCTAESVERVGGKAVGLSALLRQGMQVPPGFAVPTSAYEAWIEEIGLAREIARLLEGAETVEAQHLASDRIRTLFEAAGLPAGLQAELARAYHRLGGGEDVPVAVRSSATAEDSAAASFAGQQETYLWVHGAGSVARHVVRCWGSLFTPQAIAYRANLGMALDGLAMGVVVQRIVAADAAGVMMTLDPVTGDPSQITIEAAFGLGTAVVGGEVTPDRYGVDKVTLEIRSRAVMTKHVAHRFDPECGEVRAQEVPADLQDTPCLADGEVIEIARLGKRIERALGCAQDVEWAVGPGIDSEREVFLLQARPETVWSARARQPIAPSGSTVMDRMLKMMMPRRG
jgi:phosphoenolpyruvate synthase/pyruvate phosphate dikinase